MAFVISVAQKPRAKRCTAIIGDKCLGMLEAAMEVYPEAKYQSCIVHFYRNEFSVVPRGKKVKKLQWKKPRW